MLDSHYSADLPITYVQARLLLDSITDYANNPYRRCASRYFEYVGAWVYEPRNIVARYIDPEYASVVSNYSSVGYLVQTLPDSALPSEIKRLGVDFLSDVSDLSKDDSCWYRTPPVKKTTGPTETKPPMTAYGRARVQQIIRWYGLEGISQTVGLAAFVA